MEKLKIGKVIIPNQLVLAPMAAVNCPAFRVLCKRYGAGLVYTPMMHCNGLVNIFNEDKNKAKELYINFQEEERPLSAQLVGSDPKYMAEAAEILSEHANIIDINFGCPETNILAGKAGAFFIKHPEQMDKVLNSVLKNTNLPVTAKIRIGWDNNSINALEVCKKLEDFNLSAIAVHGRTKQQGYSGKADWEIIKKVKEKVNIPIIGNGDIFKPGTAKAMIEQTKCDFVMIGRAALGNPFIFKRTLELLKDGTTPPEPSEKETISSFFEFLKLYEKQERQNFTELRDHAMWFTKGLKGSKKMRPEITKLQDKESLINYFKEIK